MIDSVLNIAFCLSTAITLVILFLPSQYQPGTSSATNAQHGSQKPKTSVQILVLGDIGRSPRMQYHALSIANRGGQVVIIGYKGTVLCLVDAMSSIDRLDIESDPHPDIVSHPNISIVPLHPHPAILQTSNKLLFTIYGPLKVLFQIACLWKCLAYTTKPARWLLVQVRNYGRPVLENTDSPGAVEPTVNSQFSHCIDCLLSSADETCH